MQDNRCTSAHARWQGRVGDARISNLWGGSSVGRASRSQCEGRGFDPLPLHNFAGIIFSWVLPGFLVCAQDHCLHCLRIRAGGSAREGGNRRGKELRLAPVAQWGEGGDPVRTQFASARTPGQEVRAGGSAREGGNRRGKELRLAPVAQWGEGGDPVRTQFASARTPGQEVRAGGSAREGGNRRGKELRLAPVAQLDRASPS